MKIFFIVLLFFLLLPIVLKASMTGGDFEIYADSFSVVQDDLSTTGGNFTFFNTGGDSSSVLATSATGSIYNNLVGWDLAGSEFTIGDGAVTTTFIFANNAGTGNGSLNGDRKVMVETGGGGGTTVGGMTDRIAEAINHPNAKLGIFATSDGTNTVSLVNSRTSGSDGNVAITETEDDADDFIVRGMSGGGNISSGLALKGGFQAMERSSLSMDVSPATVSLGQLSLSSVSSGSVVMTVTTDSSTGYAVSVGEDGNLRKGNSGGNDDINDVSDGTVSAGSEEYGIATTGGGGLLSSDTAISGTLSVVSSNSSVTSQQTTITFKAAIGGSSRAGSYSHIVTFTATANP